SLSRTQSALSALTGALGQRLRLASLSCRSRHLHCGGAACPLRYFVPLESLGLATAIHRPANVLCGKRVYLGCACLIPRTRPQRLWFADSAAVFPIGRGGLSSGRETALVRLLAGSGRCL